MKTFTSSAKGAAFAAAAGLIGASGAALSRAGFGMIGGAIMMFAVSQESTLQMLMLTSLTTQHWPGYSQQNYPQTQVQH